jgi:hypothetical protein
MPFSEGLGEATPASIGPAIPSCEVRRDATPTYYYDDTSERHTTTAYYDDIRRVRTHFAPMWDRSRETAFQPR